MTWNVEEFVNNTLSRSAQAMPPGPEAGARHVAILMALHNGAATVDAQLASFQAQTHRDWSLIVSDDGSTDDGTNRINKFATRIGRPVAMHAGPRMGFAQNFLHLLCAAGPVVPFAALSDQDDVWLPGKLARATEQLAALGDDKPGLYAGRTVICDSDLRPLRPSPLFELPPGFANALVQNIGGGNTMVLNRAALDLAQNTARHANGIVAHDWWLYQLVTGAGGHVIYDPEPMVFYRQHSGNLIGANDTALASAIRLVQLFRGRFRRWNSANIRALISSAHWLTPEARKTLASFERARSGSAFARLCAVDEAGLYRQTRRGDAALKLAAFLRRI